MYSNTYRNRFEAVCAHYLGDGNDMRRLAELKALREDIERQIVRDRDAGLGVVELLDLFEVVCDEL